MSDYRNPDPYDPYTRDPYGRSSQSAPWGWIAAALVLVAIVAAIMFAGGDTRMASNTNAPPTTSAPSRPATPPATPPAAAPAPAPSSPGNAQ
jgi:hypothetical protein